MKFLWAFVFITNGLILASCTSQEDQKNGDAPGSINGESAKVRPDSLDKVLSKKQLLAYDKWKDNIIKRCDLSEIFSKPKDQENPDIGIDLKALQKRNNGNKFFPIAPDHFAYLEAGKPFPFGTSASMIRFSDDGSEEQTLKVERRDENCLVYLNDEVVYTTQVYQNLVVWGDFNLNKSVPLLQQRFLKSDVSRSINKETGLTQLNISVLNELVMEFIKPNELFYQSIAKYLDLPINLAKRTLLSYSRENFPRDKFTDRDIFLKTLSPFPNIDFATDGLYSSEDFYVQSKKFEELSALRRYSVNFKLQFIPFSNSEINEQQTQTLQMPQVFDFEVQITPPQKIDGKSIFFLKRIAYLGEAKYEVADYKECLENRFKHLFQANPYRKTVVEPEVLDLNHSCRMYQNYLSPQETENALYPILVKILSSSTFSEIHKYNHWDEYLMSVYQFALSQNKSLQEVLGISDSPPPWLIRIDTLSKVLRKYKNQTAVLFPKAVDELPVTATLDSYEITPEVYELALKAYVSYWETLPIFFESLFTDFSRSKEITAKEVQFLKNLNDEYIKQFQLTVKHATKIHYTLFNGSDVYLRENLWTLQQLVEFDTIVQLLDRIYSKETVFDSDYSLVNEFSFNFYKATNFKLTERTLLALSKISFVFRSGGLRQFILANARGRDYPIQFTDYIESLSEDSLKDLKKISDNLEKLKVADLGNLFINQILVKLPNPQLLKGYADLSQTLALFKAREQKRIVTVINSFERDFANFASRAFKIILNEQDIISFEWLAELFIFSPSCQHKTNFETVSSRYRCYPQIVGKEFGMAFYPVIYQTYFDLSVKLLNLFKNNKNPFSSSWRQRFFDYYFSPKFLSCGRDQMILESAKIIQSLDQLSTEVDSPQRELKMNDFLKTLPLCK